MPCDIHALRTDDVGFARPLPVPEKVPPLRFPRRRSFHALGRHFGPVIANSTIHMRIPSSFLASPRFAYSLLQMLRRKLILMFVPLVVLLVAVAVVAIILLQDVLYQLSNSVA